MHLILADAGVVGNYGDARIMVQNTPTNVKTGIKDANQNYLTDQQLSTLNATEGIRINVVSAWSTRLLFVEAIPTGDNTQPGSVNDSR